MTLGDDGARRLARVTSGVPGLDEILRGGLLRAGLYIVEGSPGSGKTILANQLCFHHVREGGRALYVTLLAENHARMLLHIGQLSFFDEGAIPGAVYYISAFRVLEEAGLRGLLDLLRNEVRQHGASVLVLDGLVAVAETAETAREFKKFIHELQVQAALADCTMLLLTGTPTRPASAEHTMVDGVIELRSVLFGRTAQRELLVHKMRGTAQLRGRHVFRIGDDGITVFPRIEARLAKPSLPDGIPGAPLATGLRQLDRLTGGGLPGGSATLLVGPPGCGKTTFGLHFLGRSSRREPGLFFGFYERSGAIMAKAAALGLPIERLVAGGRLEFIWQPTTEGLLDEACEVLLEAVRRRRVRRLFIDGMGGFERLATEPERLGHIFAALSSELRALEVTTIYTAEAEPIGNVGGLPLSGLALLGVSAVAENIVVMRFVELRSRLHRLLSVMKMRDAAIDSSLRLFRITAAGFEIDADAAAAEAMLAEAAGQALAGGGAPVRSTLLPNARGGER